MYSTLTNAVAATTTSIDQLNELAREGWQQWAAGNITDDAAETLQSLVSARKTSLRASIASQSEHPPLPTRRHPARARDRRKSITRRRRTAMAGVLPGALAVHFTMGEVACLSVIAQEAKRQRRNQCEFPVEKIAGLAGVCATVVRTALREARHLGLVVVTERRRAGQRSLTNIIDIVGPEWRLWLKLGGVGALLRTPRITREIKTGRSSFVHVGAEERYSQPDKPGRRSAELARFEQEIGSTPPKGIGTRNANRC